MIKVALGLGSNLGDRRLNLEVAITKLRTEGVLERVVVSPLYESEALLLPDAPVGWNLPFYNAVVTGHTGLSPRALLEAVKAIEVSMGRSHTKQTWAPREIDIDILLYADQNVDEPGLTIPHKHLSDRPFALLPLLDVCPEIKLVPSFSFPPPFHTRCIATLWLKSSASSM